MTLSSSVPKIILGWSYYDYLLFITPSGVLNGDTLHRKWFGKFTDYSVLKTFGYAIFFNQSEWKLEPIVRNVFS